MISPYSCILPCCIDGISPYPTVFQWVWSSSSLFYVPLGVLSYSLTQLKNQSKVIFLMIFHLGPGCNCDFLLLRVVGLTEDFRKLIFCSYFFSTGWAHVNVAMTFILSTVWWFKWFNHHTNTGVSNEWIEIKLSHKINEHVMSFAKPAIWNATSSKNEKIHPVCFPSTIWWPKGGVMLVLVKIIVCQRLAQNVDNICCWTCHKTHSEPTFAHHISLRSKLSNKKASQEKQCQCQYCKLLWIVDNKYIYVYYIMAK